MPTSFVIRANEFLFFHQFADNLPIELRETFCKPFAENFKTAMPVPEIQDSVPRSASSLRRRLVFRFGSDVICRLPQKPCPDSVRPENLFKFSPLA